MLLAITSCKKEDSYQPDQGEDVALKIGSVSLINVFGCSEEDGFCLSDSNLKSKGIGLFRIIGEGYSKEQTNIHYSYSADENLWES